MKALGIMFRTAWLLALGAGSLAWGDNSDHYRFEAESGTLTATHVESSEPGFSGTGYVTGFTQPESKVSWNVTVPEGFYEVWLRYRTRDKKGFEIMIDGVTYSGMFPPSNHGFASTQAARVRLSGSATTLSVGKGWGYFDIDYMELVPTGPPPPPAAVPDSLVDDQATPRTRALMHQLVTLYGQKTLSGVYSQRDADSVEQITGQRPAILGGDLIEYSPSRVAHGSKPARQVEDLLQQASRGAILSVIWHWNAPDDLIDGTYADPAGKTINAPWWRGFYTEATTFDVEKALADPQSKDGMLLLSDIDAIAAQLKKFSDADVPILWRPLHESEGGWFWWGAKGPKPFVQLWQLLHDRLTNVHHLHNLIWVFTGGPNPAWYPGDRYVDIVGMDAYPKDRRDPLSAQWDDEQKAYGGRKLVALSEFVSVPDLELMAQSGVRFSYFATWSHSFDPNYLSKNDLSRTYHSPEVVNQDGGRALMGR
jgi:mannan endo-1,4-beta-mannosidase